MFNPYSNCHNSCYCTYETIRILFTELLSIRHHIRHLVRVSAPLSKKTHARGFLYYLSCNNPRLFLFWLDRIVAVQSENWHVRTCDQSARKDGDGAGINCEARTQERQMAQIIHRVASVKVPPAFISVGRHQGAIDKNQSAPQFWPRSVKMHFLLIAQCYVGSLFECKSKL